MRYANRYGGKGGQAPFLKFRSAQDRESIQLCLPKYDRSDLKEAIPSHSRATAFKRRGGDWAIPARVAIRQRAWEQN
jgi:hypothetical protein